MSQTKSVESSDKKKYDIQYNQGRFSKSVLGEIFDEGKSSWMCFCKLCKVEIKVKSINNHLNTLKHKDDTTSPQEKKKT